MVLNFPQIEEKILKFWQKNKIFEKSLAKKSPAGNFIFFEGPPTANGQPHIGHTLTRFYKDAVLRYKTMQGFYVGRKAGWDTQGLPVELEVEKEIGISGKPDIEKFGIDKFNRKCRENVWRYKDEWEKMTERIGFWLDLKHPYVTYDSSYIETIWWILAKIWQKGLLYQDYKVVPYCPRCGTALSSHEVAQGYENVEETSVYLKFKVKNQENTYLLVWTTTPWTLPGNVALAVNKGVDYAKILKDEEYWILAKNRLNVVDGSFEIVEEFAGEKLLNLDYQPLFDFIKPDKRAWFVIHGDFVSTEDGTGIVHIAPAFGEEDMEVGKENNLPVLVTVELDGKIKNEIKPWAGMWVKDADPLIIEDLKERNFLFKEEIYEHDYPFCWRCKTPLLYYAKLSWFIKVSDPQVKENLIKNSQVINWVPSHIKEGRFGEWLRGIRDWAISRERYWGTPLPIWECQKCKHRECVGSFDELAKKTGQKLGKNFDPHRPQIDELTWSCPDCGGGMKRVPEVLDCWFDSGSMPFSQWHYPFENIEKVDKEERYPADFISEAIDQTRGWFYSLLAISTLIDKGACYKNVICLGHVLDAEGEKMSKSKGNVVSWNAVEQYGADPIRWFFYTVNQPGESKSFDPAEIKKTTNRMFLTLWNVFEFYKLYTKTRINADQNADKRGYISVNLRKNQRKSAHILDKWIFAKLHSLICEVTQKMNDYNLTDASRLIENFISEDLSQWYLRRSRDRFSAKGGSPPEDGHSAAGGKEASQIFYYVLLTITKLLAPFAPFLAEELYLELSQGKLKKSVHLEDWPKYDQQLIDQELTTKMETVRKICEIGHNLRVKVKIKVRQPLVALKIKDLRLKIKEDEELLDLIKEEINIKEIIFDSGIKEEIELDTEITPELRKEGWLRELTRQINGLRKEAGLTKEDLVDVYYQTDFIELENLIEEKKEYLQKETMSKNISNPPVTSADGSAFWRTGGQESMVRKESEIDGRKIILFVSE